MRFLLSLVLALCVLTPPASAAAPPSGTWESVGPNTTGGYLAFTSAKPSRIYAQPPADHRLYRSDDRGHTWRQGGLYPGGYLRGTKLAADQRDPDLIYVAGYVGGGGQGAVLRSTDAGATFQAVLTMDGDVNDVLIANGQVYASGTKGVYRSSDGRKWKLIAGSPAEADSLRAAGSDLFVTAGHDLFVIRNGKSTKAPVVAGSQLTVHGDKVLTGGGSSSGVHLSADRGASWQEVKGPFSGWILFAALTVTGDLQVESLHGHWVSTDLGRTWRATQGLAKLDVYEDLGSFPDRPAEQVVYGSGGIYTTTDANTFQRIGLPAGVVYSLAISGESLIAGTMVGSFQTTLPARDQEWGFDGKAPAAIGNRVGALAVNPESPNVVLRGRNGYRGSNDTIFLERSEDSGKTWTLLTAVDGNTKSIAIHPALPRKRTYVAAYLVNAFYFSEEAGDSLVPRIHDELRGVKAIAIDQHGLDSVWIGDVSGLYHSDDTGITMTKVLDGTVDAIAIEGERVVVAVGQSVRVSTDGGKTFKSYPTPRLSALTFGRGGVLYAASKESPVLRSSDGGRTWSKLGGAPSTESVVASPDGTWVFAGTNDGSVQRLRVKGS
ncbi:hypothetical protein SAMN05421504_109228 [Amycolatopsis xylanica]|uniref:BNR/Asp-box repeat-containing protein n=1 Tax=Amycolatopsis xylanica TaxID=589385 RepID=A0A1H3QC53_9PSEU|nr:hypothetical protein [Amycolatopsis xylanica]SDZ10668.1 hypothetical protein SAMN05421504_109228 [Amycolatopsis xylanica]